jgi:hypothetical protein
LRGRIVATDSVFEAAVDMYASASFSAYGRGKLSLHSLIVHYALNTSSNGDEALGETLRSDAGRFSRARRLSLPAWNCRDKHSYSSGPTIGRR